MKRMLQIASGDQIISAERLSSPVPLDPNQAVAKADTLNIPNLGPSKGVSLA